MSKTQVLALALSLLPVSFLEGCKKEAPDLPQAPASGRSPPSRSRAKDSTTPLLSKEEVGAIIGQPVTSVEGKGTNLTYKTGELGFETHIEVEDRDAADAVQSMTGARTATGMLGGKPEAVPGLGDEAFFGAMSTLYFRKGNAFVLVQAPNFAMQAQQRAGQKLRSATTNEERSQAIAELQQVMKGDPISEGMPGKNGDDMQAALAVVKASSKKQGTAYEAQTRAMAVALGTKVVEKL